MSRFNALRRRPAGLTLLLFANLVGSVPAWAEAKCAGSGQVFVRGKTPVRKGPGLNYSVARFLEEGRCGRLEEVSVDGKWALLRFGKRFGWVLVSRLDERSQSKAGAAKKGDAPLGSGVSRSFATVIKRSVLRERPQPGAAPRRVLPVEVRLLPLGVTEDGRWVQVRDDRGDQGWIERDALAGEGLASLPAIGLAPEAVAAEVRPQITVSEFGLSRRRVGGRQEGVHLAATVLGGLSAPSQTFDSDGAQAIRRYDLSSLSGAVAFELQLTDLGPFTARLQAVFGGVQGLATNENPDQSAGGTTAAMDLRASWPIDLGGLVLSPELGYAFDQTNLDIALPGGRQATFVSSQRHSAIVGARGQASLGKAWLVEADLAFSVGSFGTRPGTLGSAGPGFGGRGQLGLQYLFDEMWGITARYRLQVETASFSGAGSFDSSITEARLTELRHGVLAGLSFAL